MKKITRLSLLFVFALSIGCESNLDTTNGNENAMDCIPSNLQTSVVAYYPFTNASLNDFSGNNQHLVNSTTASPTSDRSSNENNAFQFDFLSGTNEYLSTSNTSSLDMLDSFSISLWYQPLQNRNAGAYELLIGREENALQWSLGLYDCRKSTFDWTGSVWDNDQNFGCGVSDVNNDWHHLTVTYNSVTDTMSLYRNGILQESSNTVHNPSVGQIGDLIIGNRYTGKIDDIIIFKTTLDQQDINDLFSMSSCN